MNASKPKGPKPAVFPEDRLPPQNLQAEQGVIGAVLLDNSAYDEAAETLRGPGDFYRDSHQVLWRHIAALRDAGQPADTITVMESLGLAGELEKVGGLDAIEQAVMSVPHSANAKYHAHIVRQKAIARDLIEAANGVLAHCYANQQTAEELVELAESAIFDVTAAADVGADVGTTAGEAAVAAMQHYELVKAGLAAGLMSGLSQLDNLTGGFKPGQLIVIAARPSMGKSALALNVLDAVTVEREAPALMLSLEMGELEVGQRLTAARARVDGDRLIKGELGPDEEIRAMQAVGVLYKAPLYIDALPSATIGRVCSRARRLAAKLGPKPDQPDRKPLALVAVDYLQRIEGDPNGPRGESRAEQVARMSTRLKGLARQLGVPVLALAQLNRKAEDRPDNRPRMADLRESGGIEADADVVILIHRPEYYKADDSPGIAELIVAKNRNGPTGKAKVAFLKAEARFANLDTHHDDFGQPAPTTLPADSATPPPPTNATAYGDEDGF